LTTQIANLKRNQNTYLHELRNSIFAIEAAKQRILKGLAHQCQDDPWIIETKQKLSRISNALERINVISEEAAAGSSQGIGSSIQDRLKTCFVKPLIDSTVDEMPSHLKEEVSISIHVPDGLNVTASETHLELVFINLLKNALEAVEGSMKPWVKVIAESDKSSTIILFVDSGRGIDDASKAFTWQYSTKRKSGGKGVGLKLAKAYAERMNGRVYYRLYDSKHTCFCVEIFHS
jgi:C4-dicarboxylate-specific signal transduction histidine kinase